MTNKAKPLSAAEKILPRPVLSKKQIDSIKKEVLKSEKILEFMIKNHQGLFGIFDSQFRVIHVNELTMKRNLFPPELLMGLSMAELVDFFKNNAPMVFYESFNEVYKLLKKVEKDGNLLGKDIYMPNLEGGMHKIHCDFYKIKTEKQIIYMIQGLDITDRETLKVVNKQLLSPGGLPGRMLENSSDVVAILNQDFMVQFINRSIESLSGLSVDEIVGHSFLEFVIDEDRNEISKAFSSIKKQSKKSTTFRFRAKNNTGEIRHFQTIATNFLHDPVINGIIINTTDISEIIFSQEKYEMTLNAINDLIFAVDDTLNVVLKNKSYSEWAKRFGWPKNPVGKRIDKIINVKDSSIDEFVSVAKLKKKISSEFDYDYKGKKFFFSVTKNPIMQDDEMVGILVVIRDETEKKVAELKRKTTEDYLRNVINESKNVIFMIDAVGKIAFWNKEAEQLIGFNSSKIVGRHFSSLEVFSKDTSLSNFVDSISQGLEDSLDELFLYCSDEHTRHFKIKAIPLKGVSKDELMGILFMGREFTSIGKRSGRLSYGDCVYVVDKNWKDSFNLIGDYVSDSRKGLVVTRQEKSKMVKINQFDCTPLLLGSEVAVAGDSSSFQRLSDEIEEFVSKNKNAIVLLDRVDYLISLFSFSEVMSLLYRLCSFVRSNEAVLVVRLNREIVDENEFALLMEELNPIPGEKIGSIEIDKTNLNILKLILLKNDTNIAISFKDVGRELGISKVTVSKRIGMLLDFGLIVVNRKGKSKHIYITRKGKSFLEQRMID